MRGMRCPRLHFFLNPKRLCFVFSPPCATSSYRPRLMFSPHAFKRSPRTLKIVDFLARPSCKIEPVLPSLSSTWVTVFLSNPISVVLFRDDNSQGLLPDFRRCYRASSNPHPLFSSTDTRKGPLPVLQFLRLPSASSTSLVKLKEATYFFPTVHPLRHPNILRPSLKQRVS